MSEKEGMYKLPNGVLLPWIAFGTGVIWKYTRRKPLFLKVNARKVLSSVKHMKLDRELKGNLFCRSILKDAYSAGFRMFDSGRIYGYSEKYVGEAIAGKDDVAVVTKCSAMDITRPGSPDTVEGNLEVSLRYLKRDAVDLYLLHWPEGDWLNYYGQIVALYKAGKCRAFGACNVKIEHLEQILEAGLPLPMVVQVELHPLNSKPDLRAYCREHGIQLMAHTPTARGGKELFGETGIMQELAKKYGKSIVQITLRWHYQNHVIPVVSAFNREHMEGDLNIFDFELSEDEMRQIDALDCQRVLLNATGIDDPNYIYNL